MKNKNILFVSIVALLAVLLSACAGVATEEAPAQTANTQPVASAEAPPVDEAPQKGQEGRARKLDAAAEALGVTVEELQAAFQAAVPAECASTDGQPNRDSNCRADMNVVAETLGVTVEELRAAFGGNKQGERDLTAAAETLGVTVEELQAAFQAAVPAECASTDGQPNRDPNCRADMNVVAETLGVTVEELQAVIGGSRRADFAAAAETLGVTEEELRAALETSRPAECASTDGQPVEEGKNCRADFAVAAETLGVTVEDLQAAIGKGGHGRGPGGQNGGQPPAQP